MWAAPQLERGVYDTPRILVASATVVSVDRDESMMGSAGTAVELVISRADVAAALAAVADGMSLITENVFEARFRFVEEMVRLGADARTDGHPAVIRCNHQPPQDPENDTPPWENHA